MKIYVNGYISILFTFLIASCTREQNSTGINGKLIGCNVDLQTTRANEGYSDSPGAFISQRIIEGDSKIALVETVYENELPVSYSDTRGKQITTDGSSNSINISKDGFIMTAYAEKEWHDNAIPSGSNGSIDDPFQKGVYFGPENVTYSGGWSIPGSPCWLNEVQITFWCWDKATDNVISNPQYTAGQNPADLLTFSFSMPSPSSSAPYNDAVNQKDMLFSYNSELRSFDDDGDIVSSNSSGSRTDDMIDIHFYHALSAVQFFTGNVPDGYRISNISIKNVASTSSVSVKGENPLTFSHSYSGKESYSQDYGLSDTSISERTGSGSKNMPGDEKTFFMIPQTLGTDAALEVTITSTTDPSDNIVSSYPLNNTVWEAGKYYIYKLNVAGEVSVEIYEQCNTTSKTNVHFTNTNNVSEFFRASIIANWYDNNGNIVAPWDASTQGTFVGLPGSGWTRGSDGFYYYASKVEAGESSNNLFNSYTLPSAPPVSGAHLEMTILVQAVAYKEGLSCTTAFNAI